MKNFYLRIFCFVSALTGSYFSYGQLDANFTSNKTSGCGNLLVAFSDISTGSPTSWSWNFGDGSPVSIQENPAHFYNTPGTYTVTLTVSNGTGSNIETKTAYIKVFTLPVANYSQNDSVGCVPLTVNFSDLSTSSGSSISSWLWNFGDGFNSAQKNPSHTYATAGTYSVSLFATDANNCTSQKIKTNLIKAFDPPVALFSLNSTFSCIAPFNATFSNTSSGNGLTYLWNFGDGSATSNAQNPPAHTYSSFGNYTITLIVTSTNNCTDTATQSLSINPFSASFSANDSSGCVSDTVIFSSTSISANSWAWTFPGGTPASSTSQNPSATYNVAGSYNVTLIAGNAQGCSDTTTINNFITVNPLPAVNFSADDSNACQVPFPVNFTAIAPTAVSWLWNFGDAGTSTLENPPHTYTSTGNYDVKLTVTDNNGCTASKQINNFIKIVEPVADFSISPKKGCIPLTVNFTDLSTASPSVNQWQWNFGDPASGANNTSSLQNPAHIFNDTGAYNITLTITNAEGCTDNVLKNDSVLAGMKPVADFTPHDTAGCHPFTVPFTNLSSSYTDEWKWIFTNGITTYNSTSFSPTQTFTDTGYFSATLIAIHHGCPDTLKIDSAVYVKPPKPVFFATPQIFCDTPYVVTFVDSSQGADNWIWKFGDATPDFTGQNPSPHSYALPGFYTVWLVTQNSGNGCIDSTSKLISISDVKVGFIKDTLSGCQPLLISFTDTSIANTAIASRKWIFGDGSSTTAGSGNITGVPNTTGTFISPKHTYINSGFYGVMLIITDQLGCSDTLQTDSLIDVKPLPVAAFTSDTTNGCSPLTINFSDTTNSASALTGWNWNFGDTNTDTLQNPSHTYPQRGQYTVTLIVRDTFNCKDTIVKTNFINATFPFTNFTVTDTICNLSPAIFTNSTTGAGLTYLWNFGDGSPTDNSAVPNHTFISASDSTIVFNISLTATDSNGCDSTMLNPIVISIPKAGFVAGAQNALCPPFDASFTDSSSSDVVSWLWNFGDGSPTIIKVTPDAAHTYVSAGFYDVSMIATNNNGCKDTLVIDSLIRVSGPSGTFTFIIDSNRCFTDVDFSGVTANASSTIWVLGDGSTATGDTVSHRYITAGSYIPVLILKDTNNCEVDIPAASAIDISTASISVNLISDTNNVFPEDPILFTGTSTSPAQVASWVWVFGDGDTSVYNVAKLPVHKYDSIGTYIVTLKITDADSCTATVSINIIITDGVVAPNIFTPNGDGINDVFIIRKNGNKEHYIVIFNRWGEKIYENTAQEIQWYGKNFAGADVTDDTYFYVLKSTKESGDVVLKKGFITVIR